MACTLLQREVLCLTWERSGVYSSDEKWREAVSAKELSVLRSEALFILSSPLASRHPSLSSCPRLVTALPEPEFILVSYPTPRRPCLLSRSPGYGSVLGRFQGSRKSGAAAPRWYTGDCDCAGLPSPCPAARRACGHGPRARAVASVSAGSALLCCLNLQSRRTQWPSSSRSWRDEARSSENPPLRLQGSPRTG